MSLTAIMARAKDGTIGIDGKIPWKCKEDMRFFRETTLHGVVIMGRKTFDSLGGKPLPDRTNIVVSNFSRAPHEDVIWARSPVEAARVAWRHSSAPFVIGGAEIYRALWDLCDVALVTEIPESYGLERGRAVFDLKLADGDRPLWIVKDVRAGLLPGLRFVRYERP
jgi:dihydrofolate reductase